MGVCYLGVSPGGNFWWICRFQPITVFFQVSLSGMNETLPFALTVRSLPVSTAVSPFNWNVVN